jgi:protein-disulfide isomerase
MKYTKNTSISTETKVAFGILALTAGIIISGLMLYKSTDTQSLGGLSEETVAKNIDTGLIFNKTKVNPGGNPAVRGVGTGTATTSTSTLPIEIVEFLDYECPACATQGEAITQQLLALYGERLTITRRVFPVHGEPSIVVARMVLASQESGSEAYQKLHAKVLETQSTWAPFGSKDREVFFRKLTTELGLNYDKLVADGNTDKYARQIDTDKADALELGIRATPSFVVNGVTRITGGVPAEYITRYIDIR